MGVVGQTSWQRGAVGAIAIAVLGAGCGISRQEFTVEYTDSLCAHLLTCGDAAELTFDGILTQEDCLDRKTYEVSQWGLGCKFQPSDGAACLDDMAALVCPPGEGQIAETPLSCATVYTACEAGSSATTDTDAG